jgi:hypothetical protein
MKKLPPKTPGEAWALLESENLNAPPDGDESAKAIAIRAKQKADRSLEIDADDSADRNRSATASMQYVLLEQAPDAATGRKVKAGAALGHERAYGTEEEKQRKRVEYRTCGLAFARDNPELKVTAVRQFVADKFGVHRRTVERSVPDLKQLIEDDKIKN